MSQYIVKNLDKINQVEVRIYQVSKEGLLTPISNFTTLDELGLSASVQLKPDYSINCTGALNYAGELDITVTNGTILLDTIGTETPVNTIDELVASLENIFGLQVVELTPYTPPVPETPALKFKIDTPEYDRYISINDWILDPDTTVTVDWGDGSPIEKFTSDSIGDLYHDYIIGASGVCVIRSDKTIPMIWLQSNAVTEITDFGDFGITNPKFSFETLIKVPAVLPTFITDMTQMFHQCLVFNDPSVINWDTSNVTNMTAVFYRSPIFNQPIGNWDVSNVTEMDSMFESSSAFNQPLDTWNTANVTDMLAMFKGASAFNQDISAWNVGNVAGMSMMFDSASSFAQNLNQWCVPNILSIPNWFANDAPQFTTNLHPVWGTCPRGENVVIKL